MSELRCPPWARLCRTQSLSLGRRVCADVRVYERPWAPSTLNTSSRNHRTEQVCPVAGVPESPRVTSASCFCGRRLCGVGHPGSLAGGMFLPHWKPPLHLAT